MTELAFISLKSQEQLMTLQKGLGISDNKDQMTAPQPAMTSVSSTRQMSAVYTSDIPFKEISTTIMDTKVREKLFAMQTLLGFPTETEIDTSLLSLEEMIEKKEDYLHLASKKRDQVDLFLIETQEFMTKLSGKDRKNKKLLSVLMNRVDSIHMLFRDLDHYVNTMNFYRNNITFRMNENDAGT